MNDIKWIAAASALFAIVSPAAFADDTGFAYTHTIKGRCMVDHFHSGTGSGKTKAAAKAAAARSWAEFTAFEYGTDWARFSKAKSVSVKYTKEENGWTATVDARPCK